YIGTFKLNPSASPKEFDWDGTGAAGAKIHLSGLYEFEGKRLRFIYRNTPAGTPPIRAGWKDVLLQAVWVEFERVDGNDAGFVPLFNGREAKDDHARWQGQWRCVSEKSGGKDWSAEELTAAGKIMVIEGDKFRVERTVDGKLVVLTGTLRLDPSKSPKHFDVE